MIYAMKYNINNSDWTIATDNLSEINVLGDFCYRNTVTETGSVKYGLIQTFFRINTETETFEEEEIFFQGWNKDIHFINHFPYPDLNINNVEMGENTIVIKKMTEQELQQLSTEDSIRIDIFDWLKQKIKETKDVPEGFELPVVSKNTITLISQAKVIITPKLETR